jgi:hypothetical protein
VPSYLIAFLPEQTPQDVLGEEVKNRLKIK